MYVNFDSPYISKTTEERRKRRRRLLQFNLAWCYYNRGLHFAGQTEDKGRRTEAKPVADVGQEEVKFCESIETVHKGIVGWFKVLIELGDQRERKRHWSALYRRKSPGTVNSPLKLSKIEFNYALTPLKRAGQSEGLLWTRMIIQLLGTFNEVLRKSLSSFRSSFLLLQQLRRWRWRCQGWEFQFNRIFYRLLCLVCESVCTTNLSFLNCHQTIKYLLLHSLAG